MNAVSHPSLLAPDMDADLQTHIGLIPAHMADGLLGYLRHGLRPGHFLEAVLSNDLAEACGRADDENRRALYDYVFLLTNYAPREAWGSREAFVRWICRGREARERAERGL